MKYQANPKLWKGRNGRLWKLADRIEATSSAIRYAAKPHDLVFPVTTLIDLTNQAKHLQWEWIAEKMGMDKRDRGQWPRL